MGLILIFLGLIALFMGLCRIWLCAGPCPKCKSWNTMRENKKSLDDHHPGSEWVAGFSHCEKCDHTWNHTNQLKPKEDDRHPWVR